MGGAAEGKGVRKNGLGFSDREAGKRPSETNNAFDDKRSNSISSLLSKGISLVAMF
jgi:hypothetical protein